MHATIRDNLWTTNGVRPDTMCDPEVVFNVDMQACISWIVIRKEERIEMSALQPAFKIVGWPGMSLIQRHRNWTLNAVSEFRDHLLSINQYCEAVTMSNLRAVIDIPCCFGQKSNL